MRIPADLGFSKSLEQSILLGWLFYWLPIWKNCSAAAVVPVVQSLNSQLFAVSYWVNSSTLSNFTGSTAPHNDLTLDVVQTSCNGLRYGTELDLDECFFAISEMPTSDGTEIFYNRHDGGPRPSLPSIPLPYRWLSRKFQISHLRWTRIHPNCTDHVSQWSL